jgi:hypothetical protein
MGWPVVPKPLTQAWLDDNAARIKALPLGKVIAVCQLAGCQRIVAGASSAYCAPNEILPPPEPELWWGNYEHGRYAWLLKAVNPIEPVPVKGALGLWEWNQ